VVRRLPYAPSRDAQRPPEPAPRFDGMPDAERELASG
jgi:hypothetical protein